MKIKRADDDIDVTFNDLDVGDTFFEACDTEEVSLYMKIMLCNVDGCGANAIRLNDSNIFVDFEGYEKVVPVNVTLTYKH